jgi:PAS domain S-box-containing protein
MGIEQAASNERATEALERERQAFAALLAVMPVAIVATDLETLVTEWNPAAESLFGYGRQEAIGRKIDELIANRADLRAEAAVFKTEAARTGRSQGITRRTRKDGSLVDVEVVSASIEIDGKQSGYYAIYHDVSELHRQKQYYESLFETSPAAIMTVDREGTVTSWNPAAERMLGYSHEEAIGRQLDDLVASRDELRDEAAEVSRLAREGGQVHRVTRRTRKDGSLIDVDVVASAISVGGEPVGYYAIYSDVSELQRQKQYYASLLELSPTAIGTVDLSDRITAWNAAAEELFGYTREEAVGRKIDDLVASNDQLHSEAVRISGRATEGPIQLITRRTRKDGSLVDVDLRVAPLIVNGERIGLFALYHDISELQRQKQYYSSLLELSPVAVLAIDLDARVTSWNAAAEQLFGYAAEEAIGRNIDDVVAQDEEHRNEAIALTERGLAGQEVNLVTQRQRRDGSVVDVEVRAAPIVVGGEQVGFYVIYHDISELQRQRRYYEALVEWSPNAIALLDPSGTITSWNPAAEQLFGYSPAEAVGRNIDDLVATDPAVRDEATSLTQVGIGHEHVHAITRRTRKDGSLVDVEIFGAPVIVGGQPVGLYGLYHDISELQRQRRYYEALFELSPTAIATVDPGVRVTSWNAAAERLFGYTRDEAIGQDLNDLVARSDELREEGTELDRETARGGVHRVTRRMRKDGSLVDVDLRAAPMVVGGETVGMFCLYHDISEIQRQRQYYQSLVESSPVAIVLQGRDGAITSWNPAAERLFGYPAEEAVGHHLDELVASHPEVSVEAAAYTEREGAGEFVHAITRRNRKDGSLVDVELLAVPVTIAEEQAGVYNIYHDITELQRAREEAEAATEAKSVFLATMSHEIRTPMNAVIGMTDLMLRTDLDNEQRSFAEVIRTSGEALLSVINDILDFSKIEAGRLDLDVHRFDLRDCVETALELVAAAAAEKGLDLAYQLAAATPEALIGDATRLRQILLNLLNNAVKFTERGEVVVSVDASRLENGSQPGGDQDLGRYRVHFAIRDTGIGIPPERLDRLFQSFSQVDASTTRRYGGTGLGLAISKRLSERMGGTMWVESAPGQGSTFHFTLEAEAGPRPSRAYERAGEIPLAGRRVLILDDNATNRHIVRAYAEGWDMLPRDTDLPGQALEWIRRGDPFDVAIIDMQMPDMDGVTVARQIRETVPAERMPLILLTSLGRREAEEETLFAARLAKPVRPSQLYDVLITVLVGERTPERRRQPAAVATGSKRPALRILVVEDNALNRQLALLLLDEIGYRADTAVNGLEALAAVEREAYDVVLMDVQMPEMDGLEATRKIHELLGSRRPRIVAATANATQEERQRSLAAGMDGYLSKPIRLEELAAALGIELLPRETAAAQGRVEPEVGPNPIDHAVLERLRQTIGDAGTRELIGTFLIEAPKVLSTIRSAAHGQDLDVLRRASHTLKSNGATFGAMALSEAGRALERLAENRSTQDVEELVARAEREFDRVRSVLEAERGEVA